MRGSNPGNLKTRLQMVQSELFWSLICEYFFFKLFKKKKIESGATPVFPEQLQLCSILHSRLSRRTATSRQVGTTANQFAAVTTEKLWQYARQKQRRTLVAKLAIFSELLLENQCGRCETKAHLSIYRSPSGDFRWHVRGLGYRVVNSMYGYISTKVTAGRRFRTDLFVQKSARVK